MDKSIVVTAQEVPRHLTYPKYEVPFKKWYEGHYECCFVLLHPFIGLPQEATAGVDDHPREELVRSAGFKVPWSEVATSTGIGSCAHLNNALLTSIAAITPRFQDGGGAAALVEWLEKQPVWPPSEGVFEELLEVDILWAFRHAGESVVHGIEELGLGSGSRPIQEIEATNCGLQGVFGGVHGSVFPASQDFLFVVDWDSFFTLFCGKQDFVGSVVAERQLEGFFSDESTSHWWSLPEAGEAS